MLLRGVACLQVRSFYSSLAKAIHQHPRRRGEESLPVSGPMRSAALYLGLVMKHSYEKLAPAASTPQVRRPGRRAVRHWRVVPLHLACSIGPHQWDFIMKDSCDMHWPNVMGVPACLLW